MSLTRNCPECKKDLFYTNKYNKNLAENKNSLCRSCAVLKQKLIGEKNPFYGKHHTEETKEKIRKNRNTNFTKTEEYRKKRREIIISSGRAFNGKSSKQLLIDKHGEELGLVKYKESLVKTSKTISGSGNHMYGKPSPQGSGNGWSGWYKGKYFRSIMELSFIINYLEKNKIKYSSAETRELSVQYTDWKGSERNYFPDFLLEEKTIAEIKPKRLIQSDGVKRKKEAAEKHFSGKYEYKIFTEDDFEKLKKEEIKKLYLSGEVLMLPRYKEKLDKYLKLEHN